MNNEQTPWLQRPIHPALPAITNEIALFAGIILLAIITRFYDLGTRVMSHDESLHTYFSWLLSRGQGYQHTPMMHGPFQFHFLALAYFLFGVSDFTARIPTVLFSIAIVWMVWYWRRYLGNWGMIVAAVLMVISPYMLYYGRYVRNESFVGFSGILLLYSILRYLETNEKKYIYLVTAATVLHFTSKETAFIYTAQALVFLGLLFLYRVTKTPWENYYPAFRAFVILLAVGSLLVFSGIAALIISREGGDALSITATAAPANPTDELAADQPIDSGGISLSSILLELGIIGIAAAGFIYFWLAYLKNEVPKERSFDLLIVILTFTLPQLTAFILETLQKLGVANVVIPTDAASVTQLDSFSMIVMGSVLAILFAITIAIGMLWDREWWKYGLLYWGVFTIFYTTVFTNPGGFFTGVVGSLGYWLVQQGVERGSQPEYYYWLVQIPMYEFLPAIGALTAVGMGLIKLYGRKQVEAESDAVQVDEVLMDATPSDPAPVEPADSNFGIFFWLMTWWCIVTIIAFTIAGERMPWLTVHMAWPMILFTGWAVGQIIESVAAKISSDSAWQSALALLVMAVFAIAVFNMIRSLYGATPPFQGTELGQLQATSAFLFPLITAIGAGALLFRLTRDDLASLTMIVLSILGLILLGSNIINGAMLLTAQSSPGFDQAMLNSYWLKFGLSFLGVLASVAGMIYISGAPRTSPLTGLAVLTVFGLLAVQTVRTSFRTNYINYNDATEYLVYAHGAGGIKEVMTQVEEISERTAGGLNAVVAYDASAPDTGVSWPMVWYLRDFTALRSFDQPTRSLREAVAVIVDQKNFDKIDAALGDGFYRFDYIRMWWPNQDYFNLDQARILNAITNPDLRAGIFDIWFDRDYTRYAQATGSSSMTLTTWQPADQMRLYVRKDVAAQIWNYGVGPSDSPVASDPYEGGTVILPADQVFGGDRYPPLGLNAPRSIAAGDNADLYVADSRNNRILHIASDGSMLQEWGTKADIAFGEAPVGTFNEPWGVAVGPDGSVYVTDTWNHRVQKFNRTGEPIKTWGRFGQPLPEDPASIEYFWGPRGIAVDSLGRVFVADTGNKRIVVFDEDGNYLTEFGSSGFDPGQFDEPVGVAVG
ncbi:MAG TPA: flippase activity-associated protein Agl23, partial [Anaerolineales bacterium]|nr:flippase activity-associated protein Agl23 [Anaerolineales bacterium]